MSIKAAEKVKFSAQKCKENEGKKRYQI